MSKAFDTHPQTPDRIEKSQEEIRKILPAKQQYVVTTSEFDEVKARLAAIENKHKLLDEKDSNKPSLRRTSNTTDKSGDTEARRRPSDTEAARRLELGAAGKRIRPHPLCRSIDPTKRTGGCGRRFYFCGD